VKAAKLTAVVIGVVAVIGVSGCGGSEDAATTVDQKAYCEENGWRYEATGNNCVRTTATTAATTAATVAEPASEPTAGDASSDESCGAIEPRDAAADMPEEITAIGTDCKSARQVANSVTIEGSDPPEGFECPDATTYAAERITCTKGSVRVEWRVRFR
jgi:hypothetical protein